MTDHRNPNKIGVASLESHLVFRIGYLEKFRERPPPLVFMEETGGGLGRLNARVASRQVLFSRLAYSHIGGIITQGSGVLRG